jgi:vancomycin resistance protein YoaR
MAESTQTLRYESPARAGNLGAHFLAWLLSWLVALLLLAGMVGWRYEVAYEGRIYEGVSVNGVSLGGMTPAQAAAVLHERLPQVGDERLVLHLDDESWVATTVDLGIHPDPVGTAARAYQVGREGEPAPEQWLRRFMLWRGTTNSGQVQPLYARNPAAVEALLTRIANEVARDPRDAALHIQGLSVSATPALPGRQLDLEASRERLLEALATNQRTVALVTVERAPFIIGAEAAAEKARALFDRPLMLYFEQTDFRQQEGSFVPVTERRQWLVERSRLAEMLFVFSEVNDAGQYVLDVRLKPESLREELGVLAASLARAPRDARFDYDPNTGALTPLVISQEGLRLDVEATMLAVEQAIDGGGHEVMLAVTRIPPEVATSDMDRLNITGLAVEGISDYTGSPHERVVNIGVSAQQYHGIVIPPGGEFSFNEHLGWVVDANGYEEGYIISGNRTEVDVGGGVCQVSTTVFRAAFYAGFDIVERHAHAYRVPYYENGWPIGFDATIFSPYVDLKFRNNTENYYLMQVENNPEAFTLAVNLYGPPTGRQVEAVATVLERSQPAPPVYEDDPALPAGVTRQVDWEYEGARVKLERIIRDASGAEIKRDEFWSNFRPWQARFLVGTGG